MSYTRQQAAEVVRSFLSSNGYRPAASGGQESVRYVGGREYSRPLFIFLLLVLIGGLAGLASVLPLLPMMLRGAPGAAANLLVLAPLMLAFALMVLAAPLYYLTRKKNTIEVSMREASGGTAVAASARGTGAVRTLGLLTQALAASLLPGSMPPFALRSTRSYRKVATGVLLIVAGAVLLAADAAAIRSGGVALVSAAPFVAAAYYFKESGKTYITSLPVPQPAGASQVAAPAAQQAQVAFPAPDRVCLNCGSAVPATAAVCPSCGRPVERVYAVVHSPNMWRGSRLFRGYAVLVTERRVVGRRWVKVAGYVAYARYYSYYIAGYEKGRAPLSLSVEEYRRAYEEAYEVAKDPDFSLDRQAITRVVVRPRRFLRGGYLSIESPQGAIKISMSLGRKNLNYRFLVSGLRDLLGDEAVVEL